MYNPHQITKEFERAVGEYTGAPYVIATTSCTMAILLCMAWFKHKGFDGIVTMPKRSYIGVPASILNAGLRVQFRDEVWRGEYPFDPLPVWDSARRFTQGMYRAGQFQCTSHHWSKILGIGQGGCILHNNPEADVWLRRARFDGRTEGMDPKYDQVQYPSWHAYLSPETAAFGLSRLATLPRQNEDLPNSDYPDLSLVEAFK